MNELVQKRILAKPAHDFFSGKPLRLANGKVWSVGADLRDDNGSLTTQLNADEADFGASL
jgi:hypothetical protein